MAAGADGLRLITIPFSHFSEKARWALDHVGLEFREEPYLPLLAWGPALRAGGRRTVPVLVTPTGAIPDSTEILRWVDAQRRAPALFPEDEPGVAALEDEFDRRLGPAVSRVTYSVLLPERRVMEALIDSAPRWQARLGRVARPVLVEIIRRGMRIEPVAIARCRQRIDEIFARVAAHLADGRPYLAGDRFTAADLTFAALAAPLVMPPTHGGPIPAEEMWPAACRVLVDEMRATPAGQFAMRLYRNDRWRGPS